VEVSLKEQSAANGQTAAEGSKRTLGLSEFPAPQAEEPGWYPDPLGSTAERYWDGAWQEQTRESKLRLPSTWADGDDDGGKRERPLIARLRRLPTFVPLVDRDAREVRAQEREEQTRLMTIEARRQAFYRTPAGRARLSFERGHRIFQFELAIDEQQPIMIPGSYGSPSRETSDAVDILNSVVVEGWKLVNGKFLYAEMRNGVVGCYLFKRSTKRHQKMNDPWED
jgi:Protein of unknown function (DUF2510)